MQDFLFRMPRQIELGFGKSRTLNSALKTLGLERPLLVVDHHVKNAGLIDPILDQLQKAGIACTIFDEITHEPTIVEIDRAADRLQVGTACDGVIGIGGGSTIDVAKLLAVSGGFDRSVKKYIGANLIESPGVPMIMLPTTSGIGTEATPNAIVHDVEEACKKGVVSPYLIPDLVILDPELTLSLPPKVTAETGIDAFTHAIECFICNKATPMSDLFALDAMRLISQNLRRAVQHGCDDKEARYNMAVASLYGGIAITNSGTGGVHALAYPLGGKYHISHSLSNAVLLADVMAFNAQAVPEKIAAIRSLVDDVGIVIEGFDTSERVIDDLATAAMTVQRLLQNNPRSITHEDAKRIYKKAL